MTTPRARPRAEAERSSSSGGAELRNYRLDELVGKDDLATIYRATHMTLERPVQVHILRRTDWISVSRFQLAGRLAARISVPGLLPVDDAGHDERYGYYIVTPRLEARRLSDLLRDGPLEPVLVLRIASQIATALDGLHERGVIHRDVQPANVLVTKQGAAYLTNLSLAASPDTPDLSSIDEADFLTPYSAPEQRLDNTDAAPSLDVYSLGALLFHMLSGQTPPPPGSGPASLAAVSPALGSADRQLARMLDNDPAKRPAKASEAVALLRHSLRSLIDLATDDMEESRWETSAEWFENPLETVLREQGDARFNDFLSRTRRRADEVHRREAIRRLLNRWSRANFFRRAALGQLISPDQIGSYNVYSYRLRVAYEERSEPETRERPRLPEDRSASLPIPDRWNVPIEQVSSDPFEPAATREVILPNSMRLLNCNDCNGAGKVPCTTCDGRGSVNQTRKVKNPDGTTSEEKTTVPCDVCKGYGKKNCSRCQGVGDLVEEQVFRFSRRAREFLSTDDFDYDDLPSKVIIGQLEPVFEMEVDPTDSRWTSVPSLAGLIRTAYEEAGNEARGFRMVRATLEISGATVTEIDYRFEDRPHRIHLVGFTNEIAGDRSLLNYERVALVAFGALSLVLMIAIFLLVL